MKCYNCDEEVNPTLVYCNSCGVPLDTQPEDVIFDAEEKAAERRQVEAQQKAKGLLVLALFLFVATVVTRQIVLRDQHYDHTPAYRVPYSIVAEDGLEPPVALDVPPLPITIPEK